MTLHPSPYGKIEQILLAHPDVMDVAVVDEAGPDGFSFCVAYVLPHPERIEAAKSHIYATERDRRIGQWRKTFDQTYRRQVTSHAPSFVGWTSNFTNKAIDETAMREWLDRTVERIAALAPRKIMEIGCGVGLLVDRLAPGSVVYRGTDLSPIAIGALREFVATRHELQHVELLEREATDFEGVAPESVDMIILNSVAQYFPSIDYLRAVLENAAHAVAAGGHIFVGDVRHLGLLPTFHGAVQIAKASPDASCRSLKRKIALAVEQERELVIDPDFFYGLSECIPRITGAEVLIKRGSNNELTRYRYDVVLHVEGTKCSAAEQVPEGRSGELAANQLSARFNDRKIPELRLLDLTNSRVAADIAAVRLLRGADDRQLVGEINGHIGNQNAGHDPEDFWKLADGSACDVRVSCSPRSLEGRFDVTLVDRNRSVDVPSVRHAASQLADARRAPRATDPLAAAFMQKLGLELGKILIAEFPELPLAPAVIALNKAAFDEMVRAPSLVPAILADDVSWTNRETDSPNIDRDATPAKPDQS